MKKEKKSYTADDRWQAASWNWFGLSYASWLVLPRVQIQSMPSEWQKKFFEMVNQLDIVMMPPEFKELDLVVSCKKNNKFVKCPLPSYRHTLYPLK